MPFGASVRELLDALPPAMLLPLLMLSLAPFVPEPHLVEKMRMLAQGTLRKPIDIFDLFMHVIPAVLLVAKMLLMSGV